MRKELQRLNRLANTLAAVVMVMAAMLVGGILAFVLVFGIQACQEAVGH